MLTTLGAGEFIGEMSFFDKSVRSATVIAKGAVTTLEFSKENFADIYAASPQWTRRLLVSLSKRIRLMVENWPLSPAAVTRGVGRRLSGYGDGARALFRYGDGARAPLKVRRRRQGAS